MDKEEAHLLIDLHREIVQDLQKEAQSILSRLTKQLERDRVQIENCLDTLSSTEEFGRKERSALETARERLSDLSDSGNRRPTRRLRAIVEHFSELRRLLAKTRK
ncbi:MAG: hypothetical protein ABIH23_06310 [bacterium]